ncbi:MULTISPECIES: TonB-dependent siderophore receptor [unclassified Pseudoxanthomonas]|uniref:TonB-dependent receptor n=1 Tax=unclassified Pseudoxanthomonas TaxID=2645906 RepID=UPI003077C87F
MCAAHAAPVAEASAAGANDAKNLDAVEVVGEQVQKASSPKYTEKLVDTPQTITVVTKAVMDQQNLIGLRDVLSTLPGITFGAGEGGGGYGDSINLRGFTASSDITTDGVRDSAQYTRSDVFNLEAIELVNGANSAMSGAGSVGGNINLVSKAAREGDSSTFTIGAGSDKYGRVTADSNFDFENGVAVRLNAMGHSQDVPGRDEEFKHRWGFAPSIAFGLGSDTRFTLSYLHQHDNNTPQYGVPFALSPFNDGPLPGVDPETYFGYRNTSRQEIDVDMLTGVFEMDFSDNLRLRSLGRLQRVEQYTNATALQGTWCLANGMNPYTGGACATLPVGPGVPAGTVQPPGTWSPTGGPRGLVRDTENFIAHSQTDLTAFFNTGTVEHHLVAGLAFSKEDFELDSGNGFRNADGSALPDNNSAYPLQDFNNPYNVWTGPTNYVRTSRSKGSLSNQAVYLFDTMKFGEKWLLNLGARYEHNEGDTVNYAVSTTPGSIGQVTGVSTVFENEDDLFSYRAGMVYKPVEDASVYLSYANSKTPSKTSVNGACSAVTCNVDPETAVNVELGTKWDILDNLALTAALFRNERQNYKVASADPLQPEQVLDGKARVDGVALGAAGNITREWAVFANYTFLDSEVLQNAADGASDPVKGRQLTQTPRHSASLWSTYELGAWTFGYGATYQGAFYPNNTNTPAYLKTDAYWVHRAMVGYQIGDRIGLQLNVNNLFDEEYYTSIRNNLTVNATGVVTAGSGWAIPGEGRSVVLTATFRF